MLAITCTSKRAKVSREAFTFTPEGQGYFIISPWLVTGKKYPGGQEA